MFPPCDFNIFMYKNFKSGAKVRLFLKLANFLEEIFIKNNQQSIKTADYQ